MPIKRGIEVLVVGAGPVGLFSALTLARSGIKVAIVDEQFRTAARSYACALHPRALSLLDEVGLAGTLGTRGQRLDRIAFYEGADLRVEVALDGLPGKFPYLMVLPQQALEDALESRLRAEGVPVLWSHRVANVTVDAVGATVRLEKLEKSSSGYGVQTSEWIVSKEEEVRVPFVIGADGHRSRVRRALGLKLSALGPPQLFAVWELSSDGLEMREARVTLTEGKVSVLWPLGHGWWRVAVEIDEAEPFEAIREKSRLLALVGDTTSLHFDPARLKELTQQRVPGFRIARHPDVAWSMAVRFERALATAYGRETAWLVGDAAHLAPPVATQSMNVGLFEAKTLADEVAVVVRGAPRERLDAWAKARRDEIEDILAGRLRAGAGAAPFVKANAVAIADALPVSGPARAPLLAQLGLEKEEGRVAS